MNLTVPIGFSKSRSSPIETRLPFLPKIHSHAVIMTISKSIAIFRAEEAFYGITTASHKVIRHAAILLLERFHICCERSILQQLIMKWLAMRLFFFSRDLRILKIHIGSWFCEANNLEANNLLRGNVHLSKTLHTTLM